MAPPTDPIAAVMHEDPYPYYAALAASDPFAWNARLGAWVAASAEAVRAVLASATWAVRPAHLDAPPAIATTAAGELFRRLARRNDGARHEPRRRAVVAASGAMEAIVMAQSERVARACAALVRRLSFSWGDGIVNDGHAVTRLALGASVYATGDLLGISEAALPAVVDLVDALAASFAPDADCETAQCGDVAARALLELVRPLVTTSPIFAAMGREGLAVDDACANAIGLLWQGYEATAGLIGNALVGLAQTQRELHVDDARAAVSQALWADPPVQNTRRYAVEKCEIAHHTVARGDTVVVLLAASARAQGALAFGHGAHRCPGEALAVAIAEAAVREVLRAKVDLRAIVKRRRYRRSVNLRVPLFDAAALAVAL